MNLPKTDWEHLLLVYMRAPIDAAFAAGDRAERAYRFASTALGRPVTRDEWHSVDSSAESLVTELERVPLPKGVRKTEFTATAEDGAVHVRHPVSGTPGRIDVGAVDDVNILRVIEAITKGRSTPRERFLAMWRSFPERFGAEFGPGARQYPADPAVPDHAWPALADISAGLWASRADGNGGAYLSFSLGPVQPFIEASRSVRDLWTASSILSILCFEAMRPVIERHGPTALVYPSLRGNPLMDIWLRENAGLDCVPEPPRALKTSLSIPNRFVAVVPCGVNGTSATGLAEACKEAARKTWLDIAEMARTALRPVLDPLSLDWDWRWQSQVSGCFQFDATVVPAAGLDDERLARLSGGSSFQEVWPDAAAIRRLSGDGATREDRSGREPSAIGRWQAHMDYSARVMEANRSVRHVPFDHAADSDGGPFPEKCSLYGSWEQMGPDDLLQSRRFWDRATGTLGIRGVRIRDRERLCAVALAKRFAGPTYLAATLGIPPSSLRFPDTATVAAADWLRAAGIDPDAVRAEHGTWNGHWLHAGGLNPVSEDSPPPRVAKRLGKARADGSPPSYLAILMLDGDDIGGWLSGRFSPRLKDILHPEAVRSIRAGDCQAIRAALGAKRPIGPAGHASISAALGDFAVNLAPGIVREHGGTPIYSGGDDLLTLLPAARAVACADALQKAYRGLSSGDGMGDRATLSGGIVYAHHMDDLRLSLDAAREAEGAAKSDGKNTLRLHFMRRSGERAGATLPWPFADWFTDLTRQFADGASDRWTYRLRQGMPVLGSDGIPDAAVCSEIRRLGDRIEDAHWIRHARLFDRSCGELIAGWWTAYRDHMHSRPSRCDDALDSFVTLCQGASFVARSCDG